MYFINIIFQIQYSHFCHQNKSFYTLCNMHRKRNSSSRLTFTSFFFTSPCFLDFDCN